MTSEGLGIAELEKFFQTVNLPTEPIKLNQLETIKDIQLFIKSHLSIVKARNGNPRYIPYLERLQELKTILEWKH